MQVLRWKIKRVVLVLIILFLIYFWLRPKTYTYKEAVRIPSTHPSDVLEYLADFSHMINLNPTLSFFSILSESGNLEHWQYTIKYIEHLSHWPYLQNVATANFSIRSNRKNNFYLINSTHTTCFFQGWYCVESDNEFKFTLINNNYIGSKPDTLCEEIVHYGCPPLLYLFCRREVAYQRHHILHNLRRHFT